jgi:hypothetical protein
MVYTRAVFKRLRNPGEPITLADIPPDAPYLGPPETVVWAWSEVSDAWIPYADWIFEAARRVAPLSQTLEEEMNR